MSLPKPKKKISKKPKRQSQIDNNVKEEIKVVQSSSSRRTPNYYTLKEDALILNCIIN